MTMTVAFQALRARPCNARLPNIGDAKPKQTAHGRWRRHQHLSNMHNKAIAMPTVQNNFQRMRRSFRAWNTRLEERALMRLAARREKILQQRAGLDSGDAAVNFGLVVARWR